jgi:NADH:ubiquinone oxidoreductase subunit
VLKTIFTWWNGATVGALFTIAKRGKFVGEDDFGNRYYAAKTIRDGDAGRQRRWVIYKGYAEPSKVPAEWHGWLHNTFKEPPTVAPLRILGKTPYPQPHRHAVRVAAARLDPAQRQAPGCDGRLPALDARVSHGE